MKQILVLGAGKSSGVLIQWLLDRAQANDWKVVVADAALSVAQKAIGNNIYGEAKAINTNSPSEVAALISSCDLVISMLPPALHPMVAEHCLNAKKHLLTPSYISDKMLAFDAQAQQSGLTFLNEMGLDPGIDHISACQMLDEIKERGGEVKSFKSHCGGLVSKASDNNPWHYKFTWNPRNVVLAGQGEKPIQWLENNKHQTLSYEELFAHAQPIQTQSGELFETYPNRDSLSYIEVYGLNGVETFYRGTIRAKGFCEAWQFLVQLGYCDDNNEITLNAGETYGEFTDRLVNASTNRFVLDTTMGSDSFQKFLWLGLYQKDEIGLQKATPAQVLQKRLEEKWKFEPNDTDRVVMLHEVEYELNGKRYKQTAELDRSGSLQHTAMAETVGLTIAIAAKLILDGSIKKSGVLRPISKEIYVPVLDALKHYGIAFQHNEVAL